MKLGGFERALASSAQFAGPFMVTAALIAIIGNPLFYFVWKFLLPQPYESLALRLAAIVICIPVALHPWWPERLKRWLPAYWHLAIMFTVPYLFSLLMFLNHFSLPWVLTVIAGTFLLTFFMDWTFAAGTFFAGTLLAYGSFHLLRNEHLLLAIPYEIFVVYLFTLFVGSTLNQRLRQAREAEASLVRRLRSLAGQNASLMRDRNQLLGHFLNNAVIARLRRFELQYGLDEALNRMTHREQIFCGLMQADIRGFSKMFVGENELEVAQLVAQCYSEITSIGQDIAVLKPVGDCIFLYSDIDQSREDAVNNVFSLACIFVESIERVNGTLAAAHAMPISFGIGLHAGNVIYGNLASDTMVDPTVIGTNVNLTARLEEFTKAPEVLDLIGPNGMVLTEEFVWLLRKSGFAVPGLVVLDLTALGTSVRDFPAVERLYGLARESALEFAPVARERIRSTRFSFQQNLQQEPRSRHRDVEFYYEMTGSGPNIVWTMYVDVSRWPRERVHTVLREHFAHLTSALGAGEERWLVLSTGDDPGQYDETDVEAVVLELIDRLVSLDGSAGGKPLPQYSTQSHRPTPN